MAEIVTDVVAVVRDVVIGKVADVLPVGTCTKVPVYASVLELLRSTSMPGAGATALSVTVPVSAFDPMSELVLSESELKVTGAGSSVRVRDWLAPVGSVSVTAKR